VAYFVLLYLYPAKSIKSEIQLYFAVPYEISTYTSGGLVVGSAWAASPDYTTGG
jgi:hypothetical protein